MPSPAEAKAKNERDAAGGGGNKSGTSSTHAAHGSRAGLAPGGMVHDAAIAGSKAKTDREANPTGGFLSGMGTGAKYGGFAGPFGAAIGAAIGGVTGAITDESPQEAYDKAFRDALGYNGWAGGGMSGGPGQAPHGQGGGSGDSGNIPARQAFMAAMARPPINPITGTADPGAGAQPGAGQMGQPGQMLPGDWNRYGETQPEYQFYPQMSQIMMDLAKAIAGKKKPAAAPLGMPGIRTPSLMGIK